MFSPLAKWSFGLTLAKTQILDQNLFAQVNNKIKTSSDFTFSTGRSSSKRLTPLEIETGVAYFPNSNLLISFNFDYFNHTDESREDVMNLSLGLEYFLNERHAIRTGLFTNNSNSEEPSAVTRSPTEHMDMLGLSAGYTHYSQGTAITVASIYSTGKGKAQIYDGSSETRNFQKSMLDLIVSVDYGF